MSKQLVLALGLLPLFALLAVAAVREPQDAAPTVSAFAVEHSLVVAVTPEEAYDAFTGDITGWWDHSFTENPRALVIEPCPGGHFMETFGEGTDGAVHATVTYAKRGERLQFTGPLGFADMGQHFDMAHTLKFEAVEGGTRMTMSIVGLGTIQPGWDQAVQGVWHHFLDERFKPFVEGEL